MPEIGTYSLSGGRRPARKHASSDPTRDWLAQIFEISMEGERFLTEEALQTSDELAAKTRLSTFTGRKKGYCG